MDGWTPRQNRMTMEDQSRYSCKFGHLHRCTALPASLLPYNILHLLPSGSGQQTSFAMDGRTEAEGGGLIYEEEGRKGGTEAAKRSEQSAK